MTNLDTKIIGNSKASIGLKKLIVLLATSNSPVLIQGPTGSGKELVAEALHDESRRKGDFLAINCAAIPSELMEAELFGYEKGAFTGAIKSTKGKFEQANRGTIFLDEIGDMPNNLQSKLLRILENSTVTRVGGSQQTRLDIRIVCASHKNLEKLVSEGTFREDLLFRLNVLQIYVPSLTERREDVPLLVDHFIRLKCKSNISDMPRFSDCAYEFLKNYDWPGNIREVRNVVERATLFFKKQNITADDVERYLIKFDQTIINRAAEQDFIWHAFDEISTPMTSDIQVDETFHLPTPETFLRWFEFNNSVDLRVLLRDIEINLIQAALIRNNNKTSEAAKDLKILRTTLIEKIKKYGLQ